MKRNLYIEATQRILAELERGAAPWVKPWASTPGANVPHNAVTGRPYSGVNVVMLWMTHYSSNGWMTAKQAFALGGDIKGQHGTKIYFVKRLPAKRTDDEDDQKARSFSMLREYTVFNIDQIKNLPAKFYATKDIKPHHNDERDATIEEFIAATGADYRDGKGGDRAFYSPGEDFIAMPAFGAFNSASSYYGTAFHELGHWTGHKNRLARDFSGRFGDQAYAAEELVAELTAAYLCAEFSVDGELRHSGYISHWIALLKDDPKAFFTAASKAQAAADYLRGQALASGEPAEDSEPLALAA